MTALVVLAAGASRRFGRPKAIEPVGPRGEALMDYAIFDALDGDATDVVVVIGPHAEEAMVEHFAEHDVPLPHFVFQEPTGVDGRTKPWGTGHAILTAMRQLTRPCVVLNADDYYGRAAVQASCRYASTLDSHALHGAVAGYRVGATLSRSGGVSRAQLEIDADGALRAITELAEVRQRPEGITGRTLEGTIRVLPADARVSMNLWMLTPAFIPELERAFADFLEAHGEDVDREFLIPEAVTGTIRDRGGRIDVLPVGNTWFGLTFADDRAGVVQELTRLTSHGTYPSPLFGS